MLYILIYYIIGLCVAYAVWETAIIKNGKPTGIFHSLLVWIFWPIWAVGCLLGKLK